MRARATGESAEWIEPPSGAAAVGVAVHRSPPDHERASPASEPREWTAPAQRRAGARIGVPEGRSPLDHE
jgi:hypothetical protein